MSYRIGTKVKKIAGVADIGLTGVVTEMHLGYLNAVDHLRKIDAEFHAALMRSELRDFDMTVIPDGEWTNGEKEKRPAGEHMVAKSFEWIPIIENEEHEEHDAREETEA